MSDGLQQLRMPRYTIGLVTLFLLFTLNAAPRLDRLNLLQFRDASGKVQPVKIPAEWQKRRAEIVKGMISVMGRLPG